MPIKLSNANKKGSIRVNIYDLKEGSPNALIFSSNDLSEKEMDKISISSLFSLKMVFFSLFYTNQRKKMRGRSSY
ncbi:MAG: hypothetical protein GDA51_03465 [Ekhidna sp.]|nr:hypothetical protein [Ekhidna sp.]MBC6410342.1 hypothetical protein [Ekhidna sp.]MBC6425525.1 hypothetical protein [Ekhidna sp.]